MSKIKELTEKYPNFQIDLVKIISQRDPSGTNKYLKFMLDASEAFVIKYIVSGKFLDQSFIQLFQLVEKFEKFASENLLKNKDIYSYSSVKEIEMAIKEAETAAEWRNVKSTETLVLFEDATRIMVKPLTKRSSATYGKNTTWCTSTSNGQSFHSYADEGTLIYFIFKHPPAGLPEKWRKIACNRKSISASGIMYDEKDQQIGAGDVIKLMQFIGADCMSIISKEFDLNIPNTSLKKNEAGKIMLEKNIFTKEFYKNQRAEIEDYIANLTDNRAKGKKVETFEHSKDEKAAMEKERSTVMELVAEAPAADIGDAIVEEEMAEDVERPTAPRLEDAINHRPHLGGLSAEIMNAPPRPRIADDGSIDVTEALRAQLMGEKIPVVDYPDLMKGPRVQQIDRLDSMIKELGAIENMPSSAKAIFDKYGALAQLAANQDNLVKNITAEENGGDEDAGNVDTLNMWK